MAGADWSDEENDAIVADYFAMLAEDASGRAYNKAEHNRALRVAIGRGRGSVEYKHQNISAVLKGMGEDWVEGYKPAFNYQASLEDAVARWLTAHPAWLERTAHTDTAHGGFAEGQALVLGTAPTLSNAPLPDEAAHMARVARKFDAARRDARNRALGHAGEECVFLHERSTLAVAGRQDLAEGVRWVSRDEGDGAGYDIASFDAQGRDRLIEVKTTNGWDRTPFHISRNELAVADARPGDWCLMRLWNFSRAPRAFELRPPLDRHVELTPTSFQASFR